MGARSDDIPDSHRIASWRTPKRPISVVCSGCKLRESCLPAGLSLEETGRVEDFVAKRRRIPSGEGLVRAGNPFESLYAIRFGSLKSAMLSRDGVEQVTGLHLAGDLVGLDGISTGIHTCDMVALEDTEVCVIPYRRFQEIAQAVPLLQSNLRKIMSREIVREHHSMMLLANRRADERIAAFLLNLSRRLDALGYSRSEFILRMTRAEIGSYLGLSLETVSRVLSYLARNQIIDVDKKHLSILDFDKLIEVCGFCTNSADPGEAAHPESRAPAPAG